MFNFFSLIDYDPPADKLKNINTIFNIFYGLNHWEVKGGWIEERIIDQRYRLHQITHGLGVRIKIKWW